MQLVNPIFEDEEEYIRKLQCATMLLFCLQTKFGRPVKALLTEIVINNFNKWCVNVQEFAKIYRSGGE
jgi:hypothetical protein